MQILYKKNKSTAGAWKNLEPYQTSMMEIHYLLRSRLHNPNRKQFMFLDYTVYLSPGKIFEVSADFKSDSSMENIHSKYINLTA